jgi:hypothetical protein
MDGSGICTAVVRPTAGIRESSGESGVYICTLEDTSEVGPRVQVMILPILKPWSLEGIPGGPSVKPLTYRVQFTVDLSTGDGWSYFRRPTIGV